MTASRSSIASSLSGQPSGRLRRWGSIVVELPSACDICSDVSPLALDRSVPKKGGPRELSVSEICITDERSAQIRIDEIRKQEVAAAKGAPGSSARATAWQDRRRSSSIMCFRLALIKTGSMLPRSSRNPYWAYQIRRTKSGSGSVYSERRPCPPLNTLNEPHWVCRRARATFLPIR